MSVVVSGTASGFDSATSPAAGDTYATLRSVPWAPAAIVARTVTAGPVAPGASGACAVQVSPAQSYPAPLIDTRSSPGGSTCVTRQPAAAGRPPVFRGTSRSSTASP